MGFLPYISIYFSLLQHLARVLFCEIFVSDVCICVYMLICNVKYIYFWAFRQDKSKV